MWNTAVSEVPGKRLLSLHVKIGYLQLGILFADTILTGILSYNSSIHWKLHIIIQVLRTTTKSFFTLAVAAFDGLALCRS